MERNKRFLRQLTDAADLQDEALPGIPLVEIAGNTRVLVEHHRGVTEYSTQTVSLKVRFGSICITGCDLVITRMTKDQMVINGLIEGVTFFRG